VRKIGLSYSRCLRDIVEQTVHPDDVLIIIARTNFDPHDDRDWATVWSSYGRGDSIWAMPAWAGSTHTEDEFRSYTLQLWDDGKIHQPRRFGAYTPSIEHHWLDTILIAEDIERVPAVKTAWDQFVMIAGLAGVDYRPGTDDQ
jgi:hypothetical protein